MSFFSIVHVEQGAFRSSESRTEWRKLSALGAAYRDHCLLWKLFHPAAEHAGFSSPNTSETPPESARSFVYRRRDGASPDPYTGARSPLSYYVVSAQQPQPLRGVLTLTTKPYDPALRAGETVRFQLRANPSTAHRREPSSADGDKTKRSAHHDVLMQAKRSLRASGENPTDNAEEINQAATDWLISRAVRWGLRIDPDQLFCDGYTQHRLRRGGETIRFSSLDYAGVAQVADPALLRSAMLEGVGRKRAFGCGLLLVKRLE